MTAREAIARFDDGRPNSVPFQRKLAWLENLDATVRTELLSSFEGCPGESTDSPGDPADAELIIGEPHDVLYGSWLEANADREEGEFESYANSSARFNADFDRYAAFIVRTRTPLGGEVRFR